MEISSLQGDGQSSVFPITKVRFFMKGRSQSLEPKPQVALHTNIKIHEDCE